MPLLVPTLLTLLAVADPAPIDLPEPASVARWSDSVVLLVTGSSWCAGVVVDDRGTVATAYHCVASNRRVRVRTRGGAERWGRASAWRVDRDLALVEVPGLGGEVPPLPLRSGPPVQGEPVWALGHPLALAADRSPYLQGLLGWSVTRGVVGAVGTRMIQLDAPVNPGNSGGPVMDASGRVVGVTSRRLHAEGLGFAARADALAELLDHPDRRRRLGGSWGMDLALRQGLESFEVPTVGALLRADARDRIVASCAVHLPLEARWSAVTWGAADWTSLEGTLSVRLRLGTGRASTTLDLGGGAAVGQGLVGRWADDAWNLTSVPARLRPQLSARLAVAGVAFRWSLDPRPDGGSGWAGLDLEVPGTLGVW
ncbi:MAG: trypsin-like peptidase domain-containing protein [Deltaproteobacteria bacterium]|nr:trypsin-like peptidase domain-containing protein [Deltaproteobacteria bacterium]